jgi:predicted peroxiredoxin
MGERLLITSSRADQPYALLPFVVARSWHDAGHDVAIYLTRDAVELATLPAQSGGEKLGASINDVVSRGIPIWV